MYPFKLEIKNEKESNSSASYLDLLLPIGRDGQRHISIYDKLDEFNFHITTITFLSSNKPASPAYCVLISQLMKYASIALRVLMFYFEGDTTFNLASRTGIHHGTLEIGIEEVLWSIRGSYNNMKFLSHEFSMTTLQRSDFTPIRYPPPSLLFFI